MLICFLGGFDDGELCHETVIHSFCPKLNFKCEQLEQRWLKKKKDEKDYTEQDNASKYSHFPEIKSQARVWLKATRAAWCDDIMKIEMMMS